jgi:DNA-binding response OmpR family regulator
MPLPKENFSEILKVKIENSEATIKKAQKETKRIKRIAILVIDDEDDLRELIKRRLSWEGFDVYTAKDGLSGIQAARKYKPSLILLDVKMPGLDGLEVLSNLKWNKKTEHIPVFMLTAKSKIGDIDRAFSKRADGYITKPFDGKELGKMIKEKLAKYNLVGISGPV